MSEARQRMADMMAGGPAQSAQSFHMPVPSTQPMGTQPGAPNQWQFQLPQGPVSGTTTQEDFDAFQANGRPKGPLPPVKPGPPAPSFQTPGNYRQQPGFQDWMGKGDNADWYQRMMAPPG
jgi:hypothetical protein